jgi:hypothetical protein
MQKHRISTNLGIDQKITVELKQDFDVLEILSLKFSQQEIYTSICSDYGVICGRVTANNGFGLGNARVSIFIPLDTDDENDPVISKLYPYKEVTDKDDNNYRYNLLPSRQQHGGHAATGTFPDQSDILTREEVLEVYEKYYKYTVKTNSAGDFMIWGVPVGPQTIHVDVDLSDIGCFSLRPYDLQRLGIGTDGFKNKYSFKSSEDLDSLPQIVTFDKVIEVYPFWGNEELCEIGITRTDFDLSDRGVNIKPTAYLIGGVYTDNGKNAINKNCTPKTKMGRKCDLTTKSANIEAIRFLPIKDELNRPYLEFLSIDEDVPDDGGFVLPLEMNMDYVITNEFGENEYTNDFNKGIATSACYRFRFNLNDKGVERARNNADYLVPNIREYHTGNTITNQNIDDKSYYFGTEWSGYPQNAVSIDSNCGILYNEEGQFYPRDYFYRFNYNKVYTVSSLQSSYVNNGIFGKNRYLGLKELVPSEEEDCAENQTPPVNFGTKNYTFPLLISDVLLSIENLFNIVTLLFFNVLSKLFISIGQSFEDTCFLGVCPLGGLGRRLKNVGYSLMDTGQKGLPLVSYPECDECSTVALTSDGGGGDDNCVVGEVKFTATNFGGALSGIVGVITGATQINPVFPEGYLTFTQPTNGQCTGATTPTSIDNFLGIQQNYAIKTDSGIFPLSAIDTPGGFFIKTETISILGLDFLIFDDPTNSFVTQEGVFTYDIISLDYGENGPLTGSTIVQQEEGCELYDTPYNESLISLYYTQTGLTENSRGGILPTGYTAGTDVVATNVSDSDGYALPTSFNGKTYTRTTISGKSEFSNGIFFIVPGSQSNRRLLDILSEYYRRKRIGKMFCGGIVNYSFIDNWLSGSLYFFQFKAKKVSTGDEKKIKYCRNVVRFVEGPNRFYYRSAFSFSDGSTFARSNDILGFPTTIVDLGPRDEFIKEICIDKNLDPNCSVSRSIGATSFKNFGELLGLAINYRMDVSNATFELNNFFDNSGFTGQSFNNVFDGDLLQLISINSEAGIEEFDLQNPKYIGYSYQFLDPDLYPQVFKIGYTGGTSGYYGPLPVTFELDEDGERVRLCLNEPGRLTESSQKVPFYLWDKKGIGFGGTNEATSDNQSWDYTTLISISGGTVQPLQGMRNPSPYQYKFTGGTNDPSDEYLLLPMTNTFTGLTLTGMNITNEIEFDVIYSGSSTGYKQYDSEYPGYTVLRVTGGTIDEPTSGTLFIRYGIAGTWQTIPWNTGVDFILPQRQDYYNGTKQILSTPFQFYFGLKAGKTGLDKFIDLFGPKGAFPPTE